MAAVFLFRKFGCGSRDEFIEQRLASELAEVHLHLMILRAARFTRNVDAAPATSDAMNAIRRTVATFRRRNAVEKNCVPLVDGGNWLSYCRRSR